MKNYLLKVTCLSALCFGLFITSCSESDSDDSPEEEEMQVDNNDDIPTEDIPTEDIPDDGADDTPDDGVNTPNLTDTCVFCKETSFDQTNSSGTITVVYEEGTVCKGEDGKAYLNGVLQTDLNLNYEEYLVGRESFRPCEASTPENSGAN